MRSDFRKQDGCCYEKRCQWNKGHERENVIRCLANFKAQMESKNIDFNADKVKQVLVREAMNSASLKISFLSMQLNLSGWEICRQRQVSFHFHHPVGCYHPKRLKPERRQKTKPGEKQCARLLGDILILLRLFARNFIFGTEANTSAWAAVISAPFSRTEVRPVIWP